MSRASNGTYTAPTNSWNPAVEGTAIDETDWNSILDDIETALTDSLSVSGKGKVTAHIDFDENGSPGTPSSNVGRLYAGDDSGLTTLYWKDSSGNVYNLLQGASSGLTYQFDTSTTTNSDPGNGEIRFNNVTVSSVTEIAIDDLTSPGADVSAYVLSWDSATSDVRGTIMVQKSTSQTTFAIFNVTGDSVDESGYTRLAVTYVTHNGTFVAGDPLLVTFTAAGTGTTGPAGSATSYDYETRSAAILATIPSGNTFLRTAGYTTKGDGGGALYIKVGSQPSHSGKLQSADGAWWELKEIAVSPKMFGAVMDGTTNDTTAFTNFLTYCGTTGVSGAVPFGILATGSVSVTCSSDLSIECLGTIKDKDGTSASSGLVRLIDGSTKTKRLKWLGGWIDGNNSAFTAFRFDTWQDADVELDGVKNLLGTVSSAGTFSGVYSSDCVTSRTTIRRARDMAQGGATALGSVPRVWSVGGSSGSQATLIIGDVTDVHGVAVVGNMGGGTVDIRFEGVCRRVADNGVYNVGDAARVRVFNPVYDTIDEAFVNAGTGTLDVYGGHVTGATNAFIGLQNCGDVRIKGMRAENNAQIAKFRSSNTSCGALEFEDCDFDHVMATNPPLSFTAGVGTRFVDRNNRWMVHHNSGVGSGTTILDFDSDSFASIESEGSEWSLESDTSDVGAVTYFIETPTVTKQSFWRSRLVNRTGNASCILRLSGARQQLFAFDNLFAVNNIQSESAVNRDDLTTAAPRVVWGTAVPSSGYWPVGSIVRNMAPTSTGTLGWTCVTAGSPGTWITLTHALIGTNVQAYDSDLAALAANATNGLWARTGSGTGSARTIIAPAAGITVSNGDGVSGNPTLALADDLAALEALASNGFAARTGSNTWAQRTITGTSNEISVTNGDGVSGNPTLSLPSTVDLSSKTLPGVWRLVAASAVAVTRNSVNAAGDATETSLVNAALPGNSLGANGLLWARATWSYTNSASVKTLRTRWNGLAGTRIREDAVSTTASVRTEARLQNVNATNSQKAANAFNAGRSGWDASTGGVATSSADTTASVDIAFTAAWAGAVAGESITLESYEIWVCYRA